MAINEKLDSLVKEFNPSPEVIAECRSLHTDKQRALANLLEYENGSIDGFSFRENFETDLYQFDYKLNKLTAKILAIRYPQVSQDTHSPIFGSLGELKSELRNLVEKGYVVSNLKLPESLVKKIRGEVEKFRFYQKTNPKATHNGEDLLSAAESDNHTAQGTFWLKDLNEATQNSLLLSLAFDPYILSVVAGYLGCTPIHVQTNTWFSFPSNKGKDQLSENAQLYHQDKEFNKFIKVFIYLSDVGMDNGPHSYIEGSHIDELFMRGVPFSTRLTDKDILKYFAKDRIKTIMGAAGTIVFGDTSAVHKGWPIIHGHRLMLQFEYAQSLFVSPIMPFENLTLSKFETLRDFVIPPRLLSNYDSEARERYKLMLDNQRPKGPVSRVLRRLKRDLFIFRKIRL